MHIIHFNHLFPSPPILPLSSHNFCWQLHSLSFTPIPPVLSPFSAICVCLCISPSTGAGENFQRPNISEENWYFLFECTPIANRDFMGLLSIGGNWAGLTLGRSWAWNHSCCNFTCAMAFSCPANIVILQITTISDY